jgi:hypothetical protein
MTKLTTRLTTNLTRVLDEYSYIRNSTRNVLEELKVGLPHYTGAGKRQERTRRSAEEQPDHHSDMLSKSGLTFDNLSEINKLARVLYNVKDCSYDPRTDAV